MQNIFISRGFSKTSGMHGMFSLSYLFVCSLFDLCSLGFFIARVHGLDISFNGPLGLHLVYRFGFFTLHGLDSFCFLKKVRRFA